MAKDFTTPVLLGGGVLMLGAGAYLIFKPKPIVTITKVSVEYASQRGGNPQVNVPMVATIKCTNTGNTTGTPKFRLDLRKDPANPLLQVNQGVWKTMTALKPGETATFTVQSIAIPSDWATHLFECQLVLDGFKSNPWDTSGQFNVYGTPTANPTVQVQTPTVQPGDTLKVGFSGFQPNATMYASAQYVGTFSGKSDGSGGGVLTVAIPSTMPGGTYHVAVRDDYGNSATGTFSVEATSGGGGGSTPPAQPTLTASFSNGNINYSYAGFLPNGQVTLDLVGSDEPSLFSTADASGSNHGIFILVTPISGVVLLQASDSAGHQASTNVTIPMGVSTYDMTLKVTNPSALLQGATAWWAFYNDPVEGFVSDGQWHPLSSGIGFSGLSTGGFFAIFLLNAATGQQSAQFSSQTIILMVNGGTLVLDLSSGNGAWQ